MNKALDLWRNRFGSPFRDLASLQKDMDRMFETFITPWAGTNGGTVAPQFKPACEVEESNTHYLLSFDLPGIPKNQIKIELENDRLIISGERKEEKKRPDHPRAALKAEVT